MGNSFILSASASGDSAILSASTSGDDSNIPLESPTKPQSQEFAEDPVESIAYRTGISPWETEIDETRLVCPNCGDRRYTWKSRVNRKCRCINCGHFYLVYGESYCVEPIWYRYDEPKYEPADD